MNKARGQQPEWLLTSRFTIQLSEGGYLPCVMSCMNSSRVLASRKAPVKSLVVV